MSNTDNVDSNLRIGKKLPKNAFAKTIYPIYYKNDLIAFLFLPLGVRYLWKIRPIMPSTHELAINGYWMNPNHGEISCWRGRTFALAYLTEELKKKHHVYLTTRQQLAMDKKIMHEHQQRSHEYEQALKTRQDERKTRLDALRTILLKDLTTKQKIALETTIDLLDRE